MGSFPVMFLLFVLLPCFIHAEHDGLWENFKNAYNKSYESDSHEAKCQAKFINNLQVMIQHNAVNNHTYKKGINEYSDKDPEEVIEMFCKFTPFPTTSEKRFVTSERQSVPSINWKDQGKVPDVRNQDSCGACTAFSVVEAIESAIRIQSNSNDPLSVQQVVDCAGTGGCTGGNNELNYDYIIQAGGLQWDSCYPYTAQNGDCTFQDDTCIGAVVQSYVRVSPDGDETATADALAQNGPLSVGLYVSDNMVQYQSGIFSDDNCDQSINHAVLLVGYGTDNGQDYWLIENSWGDSWGDQGFMKLARNQNNMCRVATDVTYPIIA